MVRVGIIGARGYAGEELIKAFLKHPHVNITYLSARVEAAQPINKIFPYLTKRLTVTCEAYDSKKAISKADVFFLALPHTVSFQIVPALLRNGKRVIDLSADYRLKDTSVYQQWYHVVQKDKINLKKTVYGLPELYREKIKKAQLVANPGCYPTAAILGIAPAIVADLIQTDSIIIDAKSGVTGAGKKTQPEYLYSEINGTLKAYKVNQHQHMPEIEQELSSLAGKKIHVVFCPHLIPMDRGILETIYMRLQKKVTHEQVLKIYKRFYQTEPFVRVLENGVPSTKNVAGTNFCDIGFTVDEKKGLLIIVSTIDNLLKGAAGQAVQNFNIMHNFPEVTGLF